MKTISETEALDELIIATQQQAAHELELLKEQFHAAYDSLKPINLIKNALHDLTKSPDIKDDMMSNAIGIGSGMLSKKLLTGDSNNPVRKVLGTLAEFAVANLVSKYTGGISVIAGNLLKGFLNKKKG
ncbi:hypothetical protein [Flavobacterium terrisoli]|uniref:hypothetical protein n=1 Tax=Flavobacterium terrisoli TaxID=3242195 RepID=UPI0025429BA3|nr:hypothetical protein [Flavobacterium buctense]